MGRKEANGRTFEPANLNGVLCMPFYRSPARPHPAMKQQSVSKTDLVDRVAAGTGLTKIETEAVVNGFLTAVRAALKEGQRVDIRGFGTFHVRHRAARLARNPQTNEEVRVAAHYAPVFKPGLALRRAVDEAHKRRAPDA